MNDFGFNIKNDNAYKLGIDIGFFAGFLLFASAFHFIMNKFKKVPLFVQYYHIVLLVIVIYIIGLIFIKFKK